MVKTSWLVLSVLFILSACTSSVTPGPAQLQQDPAPTQSQQSPAPTQSQQDPAQLVTRTISFPEWKITDHSVQYVEVAFSDIAPANIVLRQSWDAMGMDDQGRVYIGFTSTRKDGPDDFAVFRFDPSRGEKAFLGSFIDIAKALGNWQAGEALPKGHTRLIFADGKVFMGSQGFHDMKWLINDLDKYRGAHLFSFDTAANTWQDLAVGLAGGVLLEHQGVVGMSILRDQHLLIGLSHPHSDIVFFDYQTNQVEKVVPGIPWSLGNPVSRDLIAAPSGRIYTYRGTEETPYRSQTHTVWVYDPETGTNSDTGYSMANGFWIGQAETRDGRTIYQPTVNGGLYRFDMATETFTDLGYLLPPSVVEAGRSIVFVYGVTLAPDEKTLYYLPIVADKNSTAQNPYNTGEMYAYDIATGKICFVQQFLPGIYTAADIRDDQYIYLAHFGSYDNLWSDRPRLMVIDVASLKCQKELP